MSRINKYIEQWEPVNYLTMRKDLVREFGNEFQSNKQRWFGPGMAKAYGHLVPGNREATRQIVVLRGGI